jgi:hypothetical protein
MKLTKDNLHELVQGQRIWVAKSFEMPDYYTYVGLIESRVSKDYSHHIFANESGECISIYQKHPDNDYRLRAGNIFTTYEECVEKMRINCLQTIDHFNRHQLKNNPINFS